MHSVSSDFYLSEGNQAKTFDDSMDTDTPKQQEHRTLLRERFLRVMATLVGQDAFIKMHEKTNVSCKLGSVDLDIQHIQVTDLLTPMGTVPNAILRTSDMFGIRVDNLKIDRS